MNRSLFTGTRVTEPVLIAWALAALLLVLITRAFGGPA
jgi:hypothetical protein